MSFVHIHSRLIAIYSWSSSVAYSFALLHTFPVNIHKWLENNIISQLFLKIIKIATLYAQIQRIFIEVYQQFPTSTFSSPCNLIFSHFYERFFFKYIKISFSLLLQIKGYADWGCNRQWQQHIIPLLVVDRIELHYFILYYLQSLSFKRAIDIKKTASVFIFHSFFVQLFLF